MAMPAISLLIGNVFSRVKRLACMLQKDFGPALSEIWSQLSIENDHDGAIMCTSARNGLGGCPVSGPVSVAEDLFTRVGRELDHDRPPMHTQ